MGVIFSTEMSALNLAAFQSGNVQKVKALENPHVFAALGYLQLTGLWAYISETKEPGLHKGIWLHK